MPSSGQFHIIPADPAAAWLLLEWALALEDSHDLSGAAPLSQQLVDQPKAVLPEDDPIRAVAVLHLAIARRRASAPGTAPAITAADAAQCSLTARPSGARAGSSR